MTLTDLKKQKKFDMVMRMENAMYQNYFGGDTLIVKNIIVQEGSEFGLKTTNVNQYFTSNELEFIERENILDELKEHWNIEILKRENFEDIEWLFTTKK